MRHAAHDLSGPRRRLRCLSFAVLRKGVVIVVALLGALLAAGTSPAQPLRTAFVDPFAFEPSAPNGIPLDRALAAGATMIRIPAYWNSIAPAGTELPHAAGQPRRFAPPAGFDPTNPADPRYKWARLDQLVRDVTSRGLTPVVNVSGAPLWAEDAESSLRARAFWSVDAEQFGVFARALAQRYSGSFGGLPRVRYFQVWNEPNASSLGPQVTVAPTGNRVAPETILSADEYRDLVNAWTDAVHSVHADNVSIAGGLSPFTNTVGFITIGPLPFTRKAFCLTPTGTPRPACSKTIRFDAWSIHPYTSGGPNHHAALPDDVSLGDLPELKVLVDAAVRANLIVSARPPELWVTEFSWDSNPPDRKAVPVALLPRWVAEGFYRMWRSGVSVVTWFLIRDAPLTTVYQSGLYYRGATIAQDRPKPHLAAFRFPFVAFPASGRKIFVWGRTPRGRPARVLVEQQSGRRWKKLGLVRTDANGIFQARLKRVATGVFVRASTVTGDRAVPFSLRPTVDRVFDPFGGIPNPS